MKSPTPQNFTRTPGQFENIPLLSWAVVLLGVRTVAVFRERSGSASAITINIVNFAFLLCGILLHRTPARLMAVRNVTPSVWGVILQYPLRGNCRRDTARISTNSLASARSAAERNVAAGGGIDAARRFVPSGGSAGD
jgi:short subunit fatty acids transporter